MGILDILAMVMVGLTNDQQPTEEHDMKNFDEWLSLHTLDRDDPYALNILELGVRVADCFETHTDLDLYLEYWFSIASLDSLMKGA